MLKMFEDEYKLHEVGEHGWEKCTVSDGILQELSELNCNEHNDSSDLLRQMFQHVDEVAQSLIWNASFIEPVVKARVTDNIVSTLVEKEIICDAEDDKITEGTVDIPISQNTDGDGLQNDAVDLMCILDEQTATSEQLSSASEKQLVPVLSKLSDAGLCHVCALMCSMSASQQSRLGSLVCRLLLAPRLQEKSRGPCSRAVVKALIEFMKTSPHLGCTEVLLPAMLTPHAINEENTLLQIITEALSPQHKENLLRNFLQSEPSKLGEWHIPFLQELLSSTCGDTARQQLVQLLAASTDDLACNTRFAKLLVSVIQQLGPGAPPEVQQQLAEVVNRNKSILKRTAEKALRAL